MYTLAANAMSKSVMCIEYLNRAESLTALEFIIGRLELVDELLAVLPVGTQKRILLGQELSGTLYVIFFVSRCNTDSDC